MSHSRHGFAAAVTAYGIDLVRHVPRGGRLTVEQHLHSGEPFASVAEAATALADLAESLGARNRRLDLALCGFDTHYHILELPPASEKLLRPVVEREVKELEPQLAQPVIAFSYQTPHWSKPKTLAAAVLAAAAPTSTIELIAATLEGRNIELGHVTVVPQAMQRLYEVFGAQQDPTMLVMVTSALAVIAAFVEGRVRLCWESNVRAVPGGPVDEGVLGGRLSAARHFIQQTSRGQLPSIVLVSAEPAERQAVEKLIREAVTANCQPLGPPHASPGALLALAASLDADSSDRLDLLPSHLKPSAAAGLGPRGVAAGIGTFAVAVAGWMAWTALSRVDSSYVSSRSVDSLAALERQLRGIEPVLLARKQHAERLAVLKALSGERSVPSALLAAIARATPSAVQLDTIRIERVENGWQGWAIGRGAGTHAAAAMRSIDQMFRELRQLLPDASVSFAHLSDAAQERAGEVLVRFSITIALQSTSGEMERVPNGSPD